MNSNNIILRLFVLFFIVTFGVFDSKAQYSTKEIRKSHQTYIDSLKSTPYDYVFPIFGNKVQALGIDMPMPFGVMVNYYHQDQNFSITNMEVGFNDMDLINVDEILQFNQVEGSTTAYNFRPDVWIFPFLNIYGIFVKATTETYINATVVPDFENPVTFASKVDLDASGYGFGTTAAMGLGIFWTAIDYNTTWSKLDVADNATRVGNTSLRLGHTFKFKNPESNLAVWGGAFYQNLSQKTNGTLKMSEVWPGFSEDQLNKITDGYEEWYSDLTPVQKKLVDQAVETLKENAPEEVSVSYAMDKAPIDKWSMLVGASYQINKKWQIRAESQIFGERTSNLLSLNYRFGL